jgi:hypothetical protein
MVGNPLVHVVADDLEPRQTVAVLEWSPFSLSRHGQQVESVTIHEFPAEVVGEEPVPTVVLPTPAGPMTLTIIGTSGNAASDEWFDPIGFRGFKRDYCKTLSITTPCLGT